MTSHFEKKTTRTTAMMAAEENEQPLRSMMNEVMMQVKQSHYYERVVESEPFRALCQDGSITKRHRRLAPIAGSFVVLCCVLSMLRAPTETHVSHIQVQKHKRYFRITQERVDPVRTKNLLVDKHSGHQSQLPMSASSATTTINAEPAPVASINVHDERSLEDERMLEQPAQKDGRLGETRVPVFTFYHTPEGSDTIPEGDSRLIEEWQSAWDAKGYAATVLTMEDARKHPDFDEYAAAIDYLLSSGERHRKKELRDCYLRYLAMGASQGGIMVDLDTRPSHEAQEVQRTAPSKFTLYCGMVNAGDTNDWLAQVEPQNGLPCSVHASAEEWTRVARLLGWASKQFDNLKEWTDMHSLIYLARFGEIDVVEEKHVDSWRTSSWDKCYFRHV